MIPEVLQQEKGERKMEGKSVLSCVTPALATKVRQK